MPRFSNDLQFCEVPFLQVNVMASDMEIPLPPPIEVPLLQSFESAESFDGMLETSGLGLPEQLPPVPFSGDEVLSEEKPPEVPEAEPIDDLFAFWKDLERDERNFDTWSKLLQHVQEKVSLGL